ncbi:Uncharacterized protein TCM_018537 [Theobroma cacao]|uniref:Uncharacterized protein n=1 Tax=Theobroma cacao TaxID=3641 RepID=A0A061EMA4_THECC|nr:Uncharacterized protein TCM_018537 [Theobroma cacao]
MDVSLDDAISLPKIKNLDRATFSRMGYCEDDETSTRVHKRVHQREANNDNDDEDLPQTALDEPSSSVMPSSSATNMGIDARLDDMMEKINENAKHLHLLQDTIEDRFVEVDHAITYHLDDIDQHIQCILEHQESLRGHIVQLFSKRGH